MNSDQSTGELPGAEPQVSQTIDLGGAAGSTDGTDPPSKPRTRKSKYVEPKPPSIDPDRPCWAVYEQWVTNERGRKLKPGVYWHGSKSASDEEGRDGDKGESESKIFDVWISSPVAVVARTVNSDDDSCGRLLRLVTPYGTREWVVPMEVFGGSGEDARRSLFSMGVMIALKKRGAFMEYLFAQDSAVEIMTTRRTGWHEAGGFVLPSRTIGSDKVRYQSAGGGQGPFAVKGDLADWQSKIAALCAGNPVLTMAIGCALAGPLLGHVEVLGGGVHLVGDSSSGKSLAQLIAASVWGDPKLFSASWDVSKGGLEILASARNDTVLILDEIKRADPKRVQEMAYSLANGQGKGTMTREREGRAALSWRLLALSSGERSLSEHAAISGSPAHAGADLRMVDVNAGTRKHRAFDNLHGMQGANFHRQLSVSVSQCHGHLGPAFVERLVADGDMPGLVDDFTEIRTLFAGDGAQAGRVADRFAVMALASEMAIAYGLLPWAEGSALQDCQLLYGEWLAREGAGNSEDRQILNSILDFIDRHGSSRFSGIQETEDDVKVFNRAGYWESLPCGRRLYLFNRTGLIEAAHGYGLGRVVLALDATAAIAKRDQEKGRTRNTKKCRLPGGGSAGLYVLDPEAMGRGCET